MQDKLVKTGHKKGYYAFRTILSCALFFLSVGALAATPVIITYGVEIGQKAQAEAEEDDVPAKHIESDQSSSEDSEIASFVETIE